MSERLLPNQQGPRLTPLHQAPDSLFQRGDLYTGVAGRENLTQVSSSVIEMARLALNLYTTLHEPQKPKSQARGKPIDHTMLVDAIDVTPFMHGRWSVSFATTHHDGPEDDRVWSSTFMFDMQSYSIDETYPAREDHWVVGRQEEEKKVIGKYRELREKAGSLPARLRRVKGLDDWLQRNGWKDIGEIWVADMDRFARTSLNG